MNTTSTDTTEWVADKAAKGHFEWNIDGIYLGL